MQLKSKRFCQSAPIRENLRFRFPPATSAFHLPPPSPFALPLTKIKDMPEKFILIPGRTSRQGCGINEGKFGETYLSEIQTLQVAPEDMQRLGLSNGDRVRLTSDSGQVEVAVTTAKGDELPPGLLFIAYGDLSSRLMGGDTHGSGMPNSKGLDVDLEVVGRSC
jgi:formylmethanofuran dehydrogenase subunit D